MKSLSLFASTIFLGLGLLGCTHEADAGAEDDDESLAQSEDALDVGPAGTSWSANLLTNGGFEENDFVRGVRAEDATRTNIWSVTGPLPAKCAEVSRLRFPAGAKQGSSLAELVSSGMSAASMAQVVPAAPGATYRLRAWTRSIQANAASKLVLRIQFLNHDKVVIDGGNEIAARGSEEWALNSVKARAPAGTKFVRVVALAKKRSDGRCNDLGFETTLWVDAVKLQFSL